MILLSLSVSRIAEEVAAWLGLGRMTNWWSCCSVFAWMSWRRADTARSSDERILNMSYKVWQCISRWLYAFTH